MCLHWAQICSNICMTIRLLTMVSIALYASTVAIKVILIHTTCMNGEADNCHLVIMYVYMHLVFRELDAKRYF